MPACDVDCQVIVGTATTGVVLLCGIVVACCALLIRFYEPTAVVQENPVVTARVPPVEESDDPQPIV